MNWIVARIRWIMIISGVLTCTALYYAIGPQAALHASFGATLDGPLAEVVVRNWGALIALVGAMLIYGAFDSKVRLLILNVAAISKLIFIALMLSHGKDFLNEQIGIAVAVDVLMVALFIGYLVGERRASRGDR